MSVAQWRSQAQVWWQKRSRREHMILGAGAAIVVGAILLSIGEGLLHFYQTWPAQRALWLQREWLVEDVRSLQSAPSALKPAAATQFIAQASQPGVNGQCTPQGSSANAWSCTGQSAALEAVQQWWLSGRREGFYIERFEATAQSPGLVQWTMSVRRGAAP